MKKIISFTLSLLMLLTLIAPFAATAELQEPASCGGSYWNIDWSYDAETKTLYFSDNGGAQPNFRITKPKYYDDWYNTWRPSYPWFNQQYGYIYNNAVSVVFDSSVTEILPCQCYYFQALTSVTIPETVTSVGQSAFCGATNLLDVTLPENLEYIGSESLQNTAFANANTEEEDGVTYLGSYLLYANYTLEEVTVREGTTLIADEAFDRNVKKITIPKTVTHIAYEALSQITGLESITVDSQNNVYSDIGGVLFSKDGTVLYHYPYARQCEIYYIPYTVKTVMTDFNVGNSLTNVVYPKSVTSIEKPLYYQKKGWFMGTKENYEKALKTKSYNNNVKCCKLKQSATLFEYDNKTHKPRVKLYAPNGEKLKKGTDYTIKLPKASKNINNYVIRVKLKGKYRGSFTVNYSISPKGTSVKSVKPKDYTAVVKWKKQNKNTSGYQVMVNNSSNNLNYAKKVTVKGKNKTSCTVKGLKVNTVYYARVRTYKTVNGKKVFSDWSKPKKFKTKVQL